MAIRKRRFRVSFHEDCDIELLKEHIRQLHRAASEVLSRLFHNPSAEGSILVYPQGRPDPCYEWELVDKGWGVDKLFSSELCKLDPFDPTWELFRKRDDGRMENLRRREVHYFRVALAEELGLPLDRISELLRKVLPHV